MPTEIRTGTSLLTLVNVFHTTPERQQQLIDVLMTATARAMSRQPGFVSANVHASRDGLRVVNYAQWESVEAFEAMQADPACQAEMKKVLELTRPDVHFYDVISTTHPPS
ncbi:MAG TPA: antibiotic biosynthesis monooxygenase family protein [Candidatus Dormibacteraeota bacterium]|nr:antibiotic biosynthesis monooxygenase family protein [Candidatus Dormibacteraeota bacterium]